MSKIADIGFWRAYGGFIAHVGERRVGFIIRTEEGCIAGVKTGVTHEVGIILFKITEWNQQLWINLAWVRSDARRQGIYTALYNQLKPIAVKERCQSIAGGILADNEAMIKTAEAMGRVHTSSNYVDRLDHPAMAPEER